MKTAKINHQKVNNNDHDAKTRKFLSNQEIMLSEQDKQYLADFVELKKRMKLAKMKVYDIHTKTPIFNDEGNIIKTIDEYDGVYQRKLLDLFKTVPKYGIYGKAKSNVLKKQILKSSLKSIKCKKITKHRLQLMFKLQNLKKLVLKCDL